MGHFTGQVSILLDATADGRCQRIGLGANFRFPGHRIKDNALGIHLGQVVLRRFDNYLFISSKAQPACYPPAVIPGIGKGHHTTIVHRQQPPNGAGKGDPALVPAHRLGKSNPRDQASEGLSQDSVSGFTQFVNMRNHILAAFDLLDDQIGRIDPLAACKSLGCPGRVTIRVKGTLSRRPFNRHRKIRLTSSQIINPHHQPAWRSQQAHFTMRQPQIVQHSWHAGFKLNEGTGQICRRQLFGTNFK